MMGAGIPLADSVAYLERGETEPRFQGVLVDVHRALSSGHPFSRSLGRHSGLFPPTVIELIAVGEKTGALLASLEQVALLYERQSERRQRIGAALTYPLCLAAVMLVVMVLFVKVLGPRDQGLMGMLGKDVPWPTRVLLAMSDFLSQPLWWGAALAVMIFLVLLVRRQYHQRAELRERCDALLLNLPVLGSLFSKLEGARALDALGSSLRVGLPLMSALSNAGRTVSNSSFRGRWSEASVLIRDGQGLAVALTAQGCFPRLVTSLVEVGESSGKLEEMLGRAAGLLDEEVNDSVDQALSLLEPLLLAVGGAAAAFVAVATFMPVMRLVSTLG